jgi:hypothetical protein
MQEHHRKQRQIEMPPLACNGTDQALLDSIQIQTLDPSPAPPLPRKTTLCVRHQTVGKNDCNSVEDHNDGFTGQKDTRTIATKRQPLSNDTKGVIPMPSLPSTSQAVQRVQTRRRKQKDTTTTTTLAIDIWASEEEVEYKRSVNQIDGEADDWGNNNSRSSQQHHSLRKKRKKTKSNVPLEYYYQDQNGQVQGPLAEDQMRGWIAAGYFP